MSRSPKYTSNQFGIRKGPKYKQQRNPLNLLWSTHRETPQNLLLLRLDKQQSKKFARLAPEGWRIHMWRESAHHLCPRKAVNTLICQAIIESFGRGISKRRGSGVYRAPRHGRVASTAGLLTTKHLPAIKAVYYRASCGLNRRRESRMQTERPGSD